jgi:choline dehydrogenase-like flavoprotein
MQEVFDWADYVVVGSGIGSAAFAASAIKNHKKVLILECGDWPLRDDEDWNPKSILIQGRYTNNPLHPKVFANQYSRKRADTVLTRPIVGGMSVFYGGAAFRLREADFTNWPKDCDYQQMEPYYGKAEKLMNVHGNDQLDPTRPFRSTPLKPAILPSKPAIRIQSAAKSLGLSPFAIPLAINFSKCELCNTCDGFACKVEAKIDAATILKSLKGDNLKIITSCFVDKLHFDGDQLSSIDCKFKPNEPCQNFTVKKLFLGAGTIGSAALMLKSTQPGVQFPSYEQFGRNLMRHANAIVGALFTVRTNPEQVFSKQTVIADFYEDFRKQSGFATGVIQDIYTPDSSVVRHYAPKGFRLAASILSPFIQNLLCVSEDEPQLTNRIELGAGGQIKVNHEYTTGDLERLNHLIDKAKMVLKKAGGFFPKVMKIDSFSHAVASLRMGVAPQNSATDTNGKVWGIKNLWAIDGSILPASGGVNPSLTIAANAIRIAENVGKQNEAK